MISETLCTETIVPSWEGKTNAELVDYILELRDAIYKCNADKAAIRRLLEPEE